MKSNTLKTLIPIFMLLTTLSVHAREQYILTSDSVRLYVNIKGTGPACLYIHGGPGSGSYWLEQFMGDSLEQHFQMIYLDQRGVGRSSAPSDKNYSLDRMVKDFEEVRNALGIKQWLTLGHSFGGILQMGYVKSHPEVISGMILINCTLYMNDSFSKSWLPKAMELAGDDAPAICRDTSVSVHQRMLAIMPVLGAKDEMWKIFFKNKDDNRKMNETYAGFENWNNDLSERILEFDDYWCDFSRFSAQVKQPVLFYYGETDWSIGPEHYRLAAFSEMMLWSYPGGHMPFLEDKDNLMKAINNYLVKYSF